MAAELGFFRVWETKVVGVFSYVGGGVRLIYVTRLLKERDFSVS